MLPLVLPILFLFTSGNYVHSGGAELNMTCMEFEREALLDFKSGLEDPHDKLASWKNSNCCQWWGIGCNKAGAVIAVDLPNTRYGHWILSGELRPSLTNLKSLRHLDLSFNTFKGNPVPEWFGSLKQLRYLNLSNAGFSGPFPQNIGNLSRLQYLDLGLLRLYVNNNLEWITGLVSLKHLVMDGNNFSMVGSDWIQILNNLPSLTELHMSSCNLVGPIPSSIYFVNSTSLAVLRLSFNNFNSKIPDWLANISSLVTVDMSYGGLNGRIPLGLADLPNLQFLHLAWNNLSASSSEFFKGRWKSIKVLDLSFNQLHGEFPSLIDNNNQGGALSNLQYMSLSNNQLVGKLPEWLGQLKNLVTLRINNNLLQGPIPKSLGSLQSLTYLELSYNRLNGTLPDSLGQLSELSFFDVSFNQLTGVITETHFLKLHKLKYADFSSNSFIMAINSIWIPPFQVKFLYMGSSNLGPSFPTWIRSQKEVQFLDISNASISGSIPDWFWETFSNLSLLNVSFNQLKGQLPIALNKVSISLIDLSSNQFEGPISLSNNVEIILLDLSNNKLSGPIPENIGYSLPNLLFLSLSNNQIKGKIPASIGNLKHIKIIDFSNNSLEGIIPLSFGNYSHLEALDLRKNNLSGTIPEDLGKLTFLQTLHLSDNKLSGSIPSSFQNLSSLETLDLSNNRLAGNIPQWLGKDLNSLRILKLRSNAFFGQLPSLLSNLSSLQILDLADNGFSGSIPPSFGSFKAMIQVQRQNHYLFYGDFSRKYYEDSLVVIVKGKDQKYTKIISLLVVLDLSSNNLSGELPLELTNLLGLMVFNLSKNCISGSIPEDISKLGQLSSFDLSNNRLSGTIPNSLSSLSFLGHLNLSNNEFSGKIPYNGHMTTFEASSFGGNLALCGEPLEVKCLGDESDFDEGPTLEDDGDDNFIDKWFYLSVGLGFGGGLLVPYFMLAMRKSWSESYFGFVESVVERTMLKWPREHHH